MNGGKIIKVKYFIYVLISIALFLWIFLNPYTNIKFIKNHFSILDSINSFFSSINVGYHFNFSDVCSVFRFTEYFIFGIMLSLIAGLYSKNYFLNIFTLLFLGLSVAVAEVYLKSLNGMSIGINEAVLSFVEFCIGMIFYIFINNLASPTKAHSKHKVNKYDGRR